MFIVTGEDKITVVKGDSLSIECEPADSITSSAIGELYFSCAMCDVNKIFTAYGTSYIVEFTPGETQVFEVGVGTYDITLKTTTGEIKTILHNQKIEVLDKENVVTYE